MMRLKGSEQKTSTAVREEWGCVLTRENERLTWCNTLKTLLCSGYRCNVQHVWRTTIATKGEVEHTFMKAPHFGPLVSLFLVFAEVQGERASLPLDKLQKSLSSFMDPCKEITTTSLLLWTSITNHLILCFVCLYPSFPFFTFDWPRFIWKWWQYSGKYIRNTCIKCRY